jgi:Na+/phosphate symporter
MKTCENCGAKLGDYYEICPFCFVDLVPGLETEEKRKKRKKSKKLKMLSIVISYSILIGSTISWIMISIECFNSNNRICYTNTLIFMVICWIFACITPALLGEELPKGEK